MVFIKDRKYYIVINRLKKCALAVLLLLGLLSGCSDGLVGDMGQDGREKIRLAGEISQLAVTRVNDDGFCDLDAIGVYVVDYDGNTPGTLKTNGNHGDNVKFTFDEGNGSWNSSHDLYWSDKHTHVDIYGYYPYAQPTDVGDYRFEVRRDQGEASENGQMGGYEASDFLWGKVPDVAPTASVIRVPMHHRMACARVKLEQGNGFGEGEWASLDKTVLATNLIRKASINIADGSVRAVHGGAYCHHAGKGWRRVACHCGAADCWRWHDVVLDNGWWTAVQVLAERRIHIRAGQHEQFHHTR